MTHTESGGALIERPSRLLSTDSADRASRWDDLLRLQVDLFLPQEVDFLLGERRWVDAGRILDAGCGNGYYLSRLAAYFPTKKYHGIDISEELIAIARRRMNGELRFTNADFFSLPRPKPYDAIVMRFLVQHLIDFRRVLDRAGELLRPGGSLFIIEPDLERSANFPAIPYFDEMLSRYHRSAAGEDRIRGELHAIAGQVAEMPGWAVAADHRASSPRLGPFSGTNLQRTYLRWIDLCEQSGMFAYAFDKARLAVQEWSDRSSTVSRIGLRILCVERLAQ